MTDDHASAASRPSLYELLEDDGKAWLDELVRLVNDGAYREAVDALLADEAAIAMAAIDRTDRDQSSTT